MSDMKRIVIKISFCYECYLVVNGQTQLHCSGLNKKRYSGENVMKSVKEKYVISEVQGNCKYIIYRICLRNFRPRVFCAP